MSKDKSVAVVATGNFLQQITSNVNVGIDEVVSVFVAKWEKGLFTKKDNLSAQIKAVKQQLEDLTNALIASIDKSKYERADSIWGLRSQVGDIDVLWEDTYYAKKNNISLELELYDIESKRGSSASAAYTKRYQFPIAATDVKQHAQLEKDLKGLTAELVDTMGEIKSVSRKEREVRGKLSEMKLEQSGLTELVNNPEMLKLIEVK